AATILRLQFGLDHVRVRDFPALFEVPRDLKEPLPFLSSALGRGELLVRGTAGEVILHDRNDEAAGSNFRARFGGSGKGGCAAIRSHGSETELLMHVALADILMRRVIGDVFDAAYIVRLRIEHGGGEVHPGK